MGTCNCSHAGIRTHGCPQQRITCLYCYSLLSVGGVVGLLTVVEGCPSVEITWEEWLAKALGVHWVRINKEASRFIKIQTPLYRRSEPGVKYEW